MTPIYVAIIILLAGVMVAYAKFVRQEELRHLAAERDAEHRHADDWKEFATALADGALVMREAPTIEEARLHAESLHKTDEEREPTLEELEEELYKRSDPLSVSFEGELGERRALAAKIARMKEARDSGLAERSEPLTEHIVNSLDDADVRHLEGRAS